MATAGWYPDPSGQPGAFRFWDGADWSETLADNPYGPPPGGAAPPPPPPPPPTAPIATSPPSPPPGLDQPTIVPGAPGGFESYAAAGPPSSAGQPSPSGWDGGVPPPPPSPGNGSGRTIALALVAVLVALLLGVGTFFVVRSFTDDDTSSAREPVDEPSTSQAPTEEPTDAPTQETPPTDEPSPQPSPDPPTSGSTEQPSALQCTGGLPEQGVTGQQGRFITGGGLKLPLPRDYGDAGDQGPAFTFADGVYAPAKVIEQTADSGWVAVYALGSLSRGNGFDSPRQGAETVLTCMTQSSDFYQNFTGSTELDSTDTVVDGSPAWELTAEIRIDNPELSVEGDVAKVVVVDTGDPATYGLFVSVVPIGDQAMIDEQDAAVGKLKVG